MTCKNCGCYIPKGFIKCPSCDYRRFTKYADYDTVKFFFHGVEYTCDVSTMKENKDGSISFYMKTKNNLKKSKKKC